MNNLFLPIDGVIVKIVSPEQSVLDLPEESKSKNIGEIISNDTLIKFNTGDNLTDEEQEKLFSRFNKGVKIRFTEGYLLKDIGKDVYYVKLEDIIGIYN